MFIFHFIYGNFIIPTDELIFQRGRFKPSTRACIGHQESGGYGLLLDFKWNFYHGKKNMVFPTLFCNGRPLPISGFCFGFRRSDLRQEWEKLAPTVPWRDGISKSECAARSSYMSNVEECNNGNVTLIVMSHNPIVIIVIIIVN